MRLLLITCFICGPLATAGVVAAQDSCSTQSDEKTLSGKIDDPTQGVEFYWKSVIEARNKGPYWTIKNEICNTGKRSLIVSWPKTLLQADAFNPLQPGKPLQNEYVASEPFMDGNSPITYGLNRRNSFAQAYQQKGALTGARVLYSSIATNYAIVNGNAVGIKFDFVVTAEGDRYNLTYSPASKESAALSVVILSPQIPQFAKAFADVQVKSSVENAAKIFASADTVIWGKTFSPADVGLLVQPAGGGGKVSVWLPVRPNGIEVARVLLLNREGRTVASGFVSLFQQ